MAKEDRGRKVELEKNRAIETMCEEGIILIDYGVYIDQGGQ